LETLAAENVDGKHILVELRLQNTPVKDPTLPWQKTRRTNYNFVAIEINV